MMALALKPQNFNFVSGNLGVPPDPNTCWARPLLRDQRGVVALEFAIILPALLLIFIGSLDLAFAMLAEEQLTFVTESAAVCAALKSPNCLSTKATEAWAAQRAATLPGVSAGNFTATFDAPCGGVEVVATYSYSGFALPSIPLAAEACYPSQPPTQS